VKEPESYLKREEYVLFGEQLYLVPKEMISLTGLKIERAGLHLGTFRKNRFEPSHAFALSLLPDEVTSSYELSSDSAEVISYLKGETLSCDEKKLTGKQKGWVLLCTEGLSLGWCKLSGGILKNHYPKGLRWN
jgi:NOL1/NOP2/fmu family ribosome biogenesis protein